MAINVRITTIMQGLNIFARRMRSVNGRCCQLVRDAARLYPTHNITNNGIIAHYTIS